ncbi:MAG: aminotransferase class I/II-fold pyridoxal phosphate-dependent enzyme [Candidatus Peribacteraceae bacterium]|nr:aminotransferase class I/II-fold pyridoxal phosphate-dependent enzyme [Candidatus Peribacteraceae bacterium]
MTPASFLTLPASKPDPIFAAAKAAKAAGPQAINGTIGVYMDEDGKPMVFPSVRSALEDIAKELTRRSYSYPALTGLAEYRTSVHHLLFGDSAPLIASIASTGGTGGVSLNIRLAKLMDPAITLILPTPAWANHAPLCRSAGITTVEVPYLEDGLPSVRGVMDALQRTAGNCCVLLQVGCHNPLGLDLSTAQWNEVLAAMAKKRAIAILDFAYQGFGGTPDEDAAPVRLFAQSDVLTLITWSASKNHSIYSERTGLACAVVPDEKTRIEVEAHYSTLTRGIHSAAATFGQSVVARVQSTHRDQWLKDVAGAREMLEKKRAVLKETLPASFRKAIDGHGMFAMLPLSEEQVDRLATDEKVFMTRDGRINIAGIPLKRMEELAEKIQKCAR